MSLVLLDDFNPLTAQSRPIPVPVGMYDGFLFVLTGTTAAGQALLATDDVGTIALRIQNESIVQSSFSGLFFATMRLHGAPAQVTPVAGATILSCYVGCTPDRARMPNSWFAEKDGVLQLQWNTGANTVAELTTSPRLQVYGETALQLPNFVFQQTELTEALATGGPLPTQSPQLFNVTDMFLRPSTPANVSRITVRKGNTVVHDASYDASVAISNIMDKVELGQVPGVADTSAATPNFVHIIPAAERTAAAVVGPQTNMTIQTTGATNLTTLFMAARFLGNNTNIYKSKIDAMVVEKLRTLPKDQARKFFVSTMMQSGATYTQAIQRAQQFGF